MLASDKYWTGPSAIGLPRKARKLHSEDWAVVANGFFLLLATGFVSVLRRITAMLEFIVPLMGFAQFLLCSLA